VRSKVHFIWEEGETASLCQNIPKVRSLFPVLKAVCLWIHKMCTRIFIFMVNGEIRNLGR